MKKTRLLISLLTLTLGGVSLVSCGETVVKDIDKIEVSSPKETVIVGETINLDDYVKIIKDGQEVKANYQASLTTPKTAVLNGKELKITAEGLVNVRIMYEQKSARFNVEAMSEVKAKFTKVTAEVGKRYYVDNVDTSNNTIKLTGKGAIHHNYYFATFHDPATHQGSPYVNKYYGTLRTLNGYSYEFTMDDLEGTNFNVMTGIKPDIENYYTNYDFPLTPNVLTTENNALVTYDINMVDTWINYSNGTLYTPSELGLENAGLKIEFKNVKTLDNKDQEALVVTTFLYNCEIENVNYTKENPYTYLTNAVLFDKEFYSVAKINEYIDRRLAPTPLTYTNLKTSLQAIEENKTYTMHSSISFKNSDGTPYVATEDLGLPTTETNTYTNPNGLYIDYGDDMMVSIVKRNNKLYSVTNVDENNEKLPEKVVEEMPVTGEIDIWGGNFAYFLVTALSSNNFLNNLNVLEKEESDTISTYKVGYTSSEIFFENHICLVPGYGESLYNYFTKYLSTVFYLGELNITVTSTYVNVDFVIPFAQDNSGNDINYHIENTFLDLGQDKLTPLLSGITFPM